MALGGSTCYSTALQRDGRIVVAGQFTTTGLPFKGVSRLNADGTLDNEFLRSASNTVHCAALQADGKVLLGGSFTNIAYGTAQKFLTRLNIDGTFDLTFAPLVSSNVNCLAVQPDGKIVLGGIFTNLNGQPAIVSDASTLTVPSTGLSRTVARLMAFRPQAWIAFSSSQTAIFWWEELLVNWPVIKAFISEDWMRAASSIQIL